MGNFCENKLRRMTSDHPFLADFNKEVRKSLIMELELEINKIDRKIRAIRKNKEFYFEGKLKPEFKDQLIELNHKKRILQEYLSYVKKIYYMNNRIVEGMETITVKTLTNNQMVLLDYITQNGLKDNILVKDLTDIYLYLLQEGKSELIKDIAISLTDKFNKAEGDLKDYLYSLINRLKKETKLYIRQEIQNHELLNYYAEVFKVSFNSLDIYLKIFKERIIKKIEKEITASLEYRCLLKECFDTLSVINVYDEKQQYDYLLDVIDFWLNNDQSYIYIKRLIDLKPEIVNIKDENNESIIFRILNHYFVSCQTQLRNQKKDYIHKEYYAKIFKLFYMHPLFELEDKAKLQSLIEQFKLQINRYKDSGAIVKCLDELCKKDEPVEKSESVDCNYLSYMYAAAVNKPRKNITSDYNFAIINHNAPYINRSYSVRKNDKGRYVISVHTIDMSEYIERDTPLDSYLKANMFEPDNIPSTIIADYISLDKQLARPTITYEIELLNNGRIGSSRIYKSVTKLDDIFTYSDFIFPNNNVRNAYNIMLRSFENAESSIANGFEKMCLSKVSQAVGSYFSKHDLPFIYRVQKKKTTDEFVKNINGLNITMSKLSKDDADLIFRIICEDHNNSFYDQENIGHSSSNQSYYLDLFNPIDSYITLTLQRLINEFYIYRDHYNVELWQQELIDVILRANNSKEAIKEKKYTK